MMRVSLYLSEKERLALQELASRDHTSINYVVRSMIRIQLGIDPPSESSPPDKLFSQNS